MGSERKVALAALMGLMIVLAGCTAQEPAEMDEETYKENRTNITGTGDTEVNVSGRKEPDEADAGPDNTTITVQPPEEADISNETKVKSLDLEGDWPMSGYNPGRTGYSPVNPGLYSKPDTRAWEFSIESGLTGIETVPAVKEGAVYLTSSRELYGLNGGSGEKKWEFRANEQQGMLSSPTVSEGKIYTATIDPESSDTDRNSTVYAVGKDGKKEWSYNTGSLLLGAPVVSGDKVYTGDSRGVVSVLDKDTGERLSSFDVGVGVDHSLSVRDGTVYLTADPDAELLEAWNAENGEKKWEYSTGGKITGPAVAGSKIYITSLNIDRSSYNKTVSSINLTTTIHSVNPETGKRAWKETFQGVVRETPAVARDKAFVPVSKLDEGKGTLYVLDGEGRRIGEKQFGSELLTSPSVGNTTVYLVEEEGVLHALGLNGDDRWSLDLKASPGSRPVPLQNVVLFASEPGSLHALSGNSNK
ncbi:MAG: PQQ-binding-like beta-propeller repeat protein [Candidatus Nanohaloarchaea archaeon]|nr:PQQ-binding-like beta-propeller repeat protein [Candidatus Nanohaloarchaea archaeon]